VVVNFFRGRWCPYCVTELENWRELYPRVREHGALFVAISPQTPRQNDFMIQQHALPFPLLADPGAELAEKFGIAYTIPEPHRRYYQEHPRQHSLQQRRVELPQRHRSELVAAAACGLRHPAGWNNSLQRSACGLCNLDLNSALVQ
jgi:thiol-disulfide isomerase/thioredoxin